MKVKELINLLEKQDPEKEVFIDVLHKEYMDNGDPYYSSEVMGNTFDLDDRLDDVLIFGEKVEWPTN